MTRELSDRGPRASAASPGSSKAAGRPRSLRRPPAVTFSAILIECRTLETGLLSEPAERRSSRPLSFLPSAGFSLRAGLARPWRSCWFASGVGVRADMVGGFWHFAFCNGRSGLSPLATITLFLDRVRNVQPPGLVCEFARWPLRRPALTAQRFVYLQTRDILAQILPSPRSLYPQPISA
jgi:hypothetical protein